MTDALGQATLHDYDDAGRRTKTTDPDGVCVATGCNRLGQLISRTNSLGQVTLHTTTTTNGSFAD